mgnify:CR=1 FL=1
MDSKRAKSCRKVVRMTDVMLNLNASMTGFEDLFQRTFGQSSVGFTGNVLDISYVGLTYKLLSKIDSNTRAFAVFNDRVIENPAAQYKSLDNDPSSINAMQFKFKGYQFLYVQLRSQIAYDLCREYVFYQKDAPIDKFNKTITRLNRTGKTMVVYDGTDIPLTELKKVPYVKPTKLLEQWNSFVKPQLDTKDTYNNVLFHGDPGCGKTAFVRWAATQYPKWKFILVQPQVVNKIGVISGIYDFARKRSPAVVIFEDIDLIGQNRTSESTNFTHTLGELLNNLDGMQPNHSILTVASTNNPSALDPAVTRAGRLGIPLTIEYTPEEKVKIIRTYFSRLELTDEQLLEIIGTGSKNAADLKMVAKICQIYQEYEHRKMTPYLFRRVLTMIGKEKKFEVPPPEDN